MTVLAIQDLDADDLFNILCEKNMPSEVKVLEISDSTAKTTIDGVRCNTIALHLVHGIAEKKDIEKILKEKNLVFKWL